MRRTVALVCCLLGQPAHADDTALLDFMGGQGCTFGDDSRAAAQVAGFDTAAVDGLIAATLQAGTAQQEGTYVVLDASICTIRLPDIRSDFTVASPEIAAITSAYDTYAADGSPGCFVLDAFDMFDGLRGGARGAGFDDYIAFVAAGIIRGDLRFYGPSPLATPVSFQNVTGICGDLPNGDALRRSHAFIAEGFGEYMRLKGSQARCDGDDWAPMAQDYAITVQGADPAGDPANQPEINAWLFLEYDLIAMAAGWREGLSGTEKGTPRPPLCHYP